MPLSWPILFYYLVTIKKEHKHATIPARNCSKINTNNENAWGKFESVTPRPALVKEKDVYSGQSQLKVWK